MLIVKYDDRVSHYVTKALDQAIRNGRTEPAKLLFRIVISKCGLTKKELQRMTYCLFWNGCVQGDLELTREFGGETRPA